MPPTSVSDTRHTPSLHSQEAAANPAVMQADPTRQVARWACMSSCYSCVDEPRPIHTRTPVSGPMQRGQHTPTGEQHSAHTHTHTLAQSCISGCQPAPFGLKLQAALQQWLFLLHHSSQTCEGARGQGSVCVSSPHQQYPSGVVLTMLQLLMTVMS